MPDFYDPRVAELEEIGDGAWGGAPLTRYNARIEANRIKGLQARCDLFNQRYKPGDVILVRKVLGEPETLVRTISDSGAQVLGGHSAVVYVTDGGGYWGLEFVVGLRNSEAIS